MTLDTIIFVGAFRPVFLSIIALPLPLLLGLIAALSGSRLLRLVQHAFAAGLGAQISLLGTLLLLLVIAVLAFSSLSLRQFFVLHLRMTGVAARTKLGRLALVPFDEIERVQPVRLLLLRFLRVEGGAGARIYLPIFIERWADFVESLGAIVAEDHPLRRGIADLDR